MLQKRFAPSTCAQRGLFVSDFNSLLDYRARLRFSREARLFLGIAALALPFRHFRLRGAVLLIFTHEYGLGSTYCGTRTALAIPINTLKETKMSRLYFAIAVLCWALPVADQTYATTKGLDHINRTLIKEPKYESTPKYSLIVLGSSGDEKVWMVEDGKRLFVDKNANGDLTDDGPAIEPSNVRKLDTNRWDFNYLLDAITPAGGSRHTHFDLRRWNYGEKDDNYGLSLSVDGQLPVYAGWFGTFWSTKRETAPVIHLGGAFTPKLLRAKEFTIRSGHQSLSLGFMNPGSGAGAESRLSIEALPRHLVPTLTIEWPTAGGGPPLRTHHELTERCCYWEFYSTAFEVPNGAMVGKAKVFVALPAAATPIVLTTTEFEVPVVAPSDESNPKR